MVLQDLLRSKIKKQVEFYFSDSNLPRDKFLKEQVAAEPEGYVPLRTVCSFSRMTDALGLRKGMKAEQIREGLLKEVAQALQECPSLVVDQEALRVRRSAPMPSPEEAAKALNERSIYASPFPFDATLEALTKFFSDLGDVYSVRLRRHLTSKDFKGSIFVEFASPELAEEVVTKELMYDGATLTLKPKIAYMQDKVAQRHDKPNSPFQAEGTEQMEVEIDKIEQAEQREAVPTPEVGMQEGAAAGDAAEGGQAQEGPGAGAAEAAAAPEDADIQTGTIVRFDFSEQAESEALGALKFGTVREAFGGKSAGCRFTQYFTVAAMSRYQQELRRCFWGNPDWGEKHGFVRFGEPEAAEQALKNTDEEGKKAIGKLHATLRLLEGEEEQEFLKKAAEQRAAAQARGDDGGHGRGRGRGRGRSGGRGRGRSYDNGRGRGRGQPRGRGRGQKRQRESDKDGGGYKLAKTD